MNFVGLYSGLFTLFAIGIGFLWVIKLEYYVGACSRRAVLVVGILTMAFSYFIADFMSAALVGIIGGSIIWGSTEMQDQEERAQNGQFPNNPNKLCNTFKKSHFFTLNKNNEH